MLIVQKNTDWSGTWRRPSAMSTVHVTMERISSRISEETKKPGLDVAGARGQGNISQALNLELRLEMGYLYPAVCRLRFPSFRDGCCLIFGGRWPKPNRILMPHSRSRGVVCMPLVSQVQNELLGRQASRKTL